MKVKVRQRAYSDGRSVWTADIHVAPAGSSTPERFRVTAPSTVTSKAGAERWAGETARRIAVEGRPHNTRAAREDRAAAEAADLASYVPTLAEVWPLFLEKLAADRAKPGTVTTYTRSWVHWVGPILGSLRVDVIGELECARLKAAMRERAASTANVALTALAGVLSVARQLLPALPALSVGRVRRERVEHVRVYSLEQAAALVEAATASGHPAYLVGLLLALDAGLRRQEVAALRWVDVDRGRAELTVRHSLCDGQLLTPKSGRSRRVPITSRLLAAFPAAPAGDWVVPRSASGTYSLGSTLRVLARLAEVPNLYPHALRHSFATFSLSAGADLQAVSRMLGHSNVAITASTYAHVLPGAERGAISKLESLTKTARIATVTHLAQARERRGPST